MKRLSALLIVVMGLISCNSQEQKPKGIRLNGKQLMQNQCFSCHNTQGTDKMLAPPMYRVKDHYWDEDVSKTDFVNSIVDWVMDPKEENSIMPGARRKFGLMPKQKFKKEEIKAIAEFMFDHNIEQNACSH